MASPIAPALNLHANVQPVSALLGVWHGSGVGSYPTIKSFQYDEELHWVNSGRPFVAYTQRTWAANTKREKPMHEENGFFRFVGERDSRRVELMITQCSGVQEVLAGSWTHDEAADRITITVDSTGLTRTPSARPPFVTQVRRVYTFDLDGESLEYSIYMATEKTPELTLHLKGKHTRLLPAYIADDDEEEEEQVRTPRRATIGDAQAAHWRSANVAADSSRALSTRPTVLLLSLSLLSSSTTSCWSRMRLAMSVLSRAGIRVRRPNRSDATRACSSSSAACACCARRERRGRRRFPSYSSRSNLQLASSRSGRGENVEHLATAAARCSVGLSGAKT